MLDGLIGAIDQLHRPIFDDRYDAEQAIVKATLLVQPESDRLIVVFLPWHAPTWYVNQLQKRLALLDHSVLTYYFNPSIIASELVTVKNSFEFIALSVAADVAQLRLEKGYKTIDLLGLSLGCVALCITAEKLTRFDKVVMLVPGDTLAASLWTGWRTHRLRNAYKKMGLELIDLQKEWEIIAPRTHADALKGHAVHIILAKKDRFISYSFGRQLVTDLKVAHVRVTFSEHPFGHVATLLTYSFQPKL